MNTIEIYTKDYCPYCTRARALLSAKGVSFTEIDVTHDRARQAEMTERSGRRTVPQIFIQSAHVGGYDDLSALEAAGELDRLLARDGTEREWNAQHHRLIIVGSGPATAWR